MRFAAASSSISTTVVVAVVAVVVAVAAPALTGEGGGEVVCIESSSIDIAELGRLRDDEADEEEDAVGATCKRHVV